MILARSDSVISAIPPETIPVIIILVSIVAFTIIIERMIYFWNISRLDAGDIREIKNLVITGKLDDVLLFVKKFNNPSARLVESAILTSRTGKQWIEDEIAIEGNRLVDQMEKFLSGLGTIASVAPLLGVLGTVVGIIRSFAAGAGTKGAEIGISEALITTAMGLAVAIPAYIFYNYFNAKKDNLVIEMENVTAQLLKLLR